MKMEKLDKANPPEALRPFLHHDVSLSAASQVEGYTPLELVLCAAYHQASGGKGKERHAADDPFTDQPIMSIGRLLKSPDGEAYQAIKKCREGLMMHRRGNSEACIKELLGAINYLASVALLVAEEQVASRVAEKGSVDDAAASIIHNASPDRRHCVPVDGDKYPNVMPPIPGEIPGAHHYVAALCRAGYKIDRALEMGMLTAAASGVGRKFTYAQIADMEATKKVMRQWQEK